MIIAIDPSGNFKEGKGTTGLCFFDETEDRIIKAYSISAKNYASMGAYWSAVLEDLAEAKCFVIEDYLLYASKADNQINSRMETPKFIGVIEYLCFLRKQEYHMQLASLVKTRWTNDILVHKGYIKQKGRRYQTPEGKFIDRHALDAIRHAVHYATFKMERS